MTVEECVIRELQRIMNELKEKKQKELIKK
jgi:hypothetical protein